MEESIPALLVAHRRALTTLYAALSPLPLPLLAAEETALLETIKQSTLSQLITAQSLLSTARTTLEDRSTLLRRWRTALGEQEGRTTEGSVLQMLDETESQLTALKSRVKQRAESIIVLQSKLTEFSDILGRDWLGVVLDFDQGQGQGWEGLDLRIERVSELEKEVLRCEDELVSPPFPLSNSTNTHYDRQTGGKSSISTSTKSSPFGPNSVFINPSPNLPRQLIRRRKQTHRWRIRLTRRY